LPYTGGCHLQCRARSVASLGAAGGRAPTAASPGKQPSPWLASDAVR
jgi:hypothetical protein